MVNSRTFKDLWNEIQDFQAPVPFSSTFKALNLREKNASTFNYFEGYVGTLQYTVEKNSRLTPLSNDSTASSRRDTLHSSVAHAAPILALYSVCWVSWLVNSLTWDASSNWAYMHIQTNTLLKTLIFKNIRDGLQPQGQYWIEYLSSTNNSPSIYGRC